MEQFKTIHYSFIDSAHLYPAESCNSQEFIIKHINQNIIKATKNPSQSTDNKKMNYYDNPKSPSNLWIYEEFSSQIFSYALEQSILKYIKVWKTFDSASRLSCAISQLNEHGLDSNVSPDLLFYCQLLHSFFSLLLFWLGKTKFLSHLFPQSSRLLGEEQSALNLLLAEISEKPGPSAIVGHFWIQ